MSTRGYIEPCLGAGAVLLALLDPTLVPFCGYMGGKRKFAARILHSLGRRPGEGAKEVAISEAGPLGWVWSELMSMERAEAVAEVLYGWEGCGPVELWNHLVARPPSIDRAVRAAQVLWIQGRMATCCPVIWEGERWEMGDKPRRSGRPSRQTVQMDGHAVERAQKVAFPRRQAKGKGFNVAGAGGLLLPRTVAGRVLAIARALSRQPVHFHHGDYANAIPAGDLSGWDIYWDPPYQGATSYAVDLPRERVLRDAQDLRARGAQLTISEAVPLPIRRWRHIDLTREGGKPEWLTCSRWPMAAQLPIHFGNAADLAAQQATS